MYKYNSLISIIKLIKNSIKEKLIKILLIIMKKKYIYINIKSFKKKIFFFFFFFLQYSLSMTFDYKK